MNLKRRWPRAPARACREDGFYSFISYSKRDDEVRVIKPVIDGYCEALRTKVPYIPVFYDGFYPPSGPSELLRHLEDAIHSSDFTTSFLSPGYASSAWCGFEWWESFRITRYECPRCRTHPSLLHIFWKRFEDELSDRIFDQGNAYCVNIAEEIERKDYRGAVEKAVSGTLEFLDRAYG